MNKDELIYFTHTQQFYRFIILKKIDENKSINIPIELEDDEFLEATSKVHINNLLQEGLIVSQEGSIKLTQDGLSALNKHYIDYQISLMNLSNNLGEFYSNKINLKNRTKSQDTTQTREIPTYIAGCNVDDPLTVQ